MALLAGKRLKSGRGKNRAGEATIMVWNDAEAV
jgi:hypothetical protein